MRGPLCHMTCFNHPFQSSDLGNKYDLVSTFKLVFTFKLVPFTYQGLPAFM